MSKHLIKEKIDLELPENMDELPKLVVSLDDWQIEEIDNEGFVVITEETALTISGSNDDAPPTVGNVEGDDKTAPQDSRKPQINVILVTTFCFVFLIQSISNLWSGEVGFRYFFAVMVMLLAGVGLITLRKIKIKISTD